MIRAAITGDLLGWTGLSGDATRPLLETELEPVTAVRGPVEAERPRGRFAVLTYERPQAPQEVEAWFPVGAEQAAVVEFDDGVVGDVDALLDALGEPELEETRKRFDPDAFVTEQVYASRGLTLSVATPFEHVEAPPAGVRRIVHVQLYEPTTPELWVGRIGAGLPLRPFPPG